MGVIKNNYLGVTSEMVKDMLVVCIWVYLDGV